MNKTRIEYLDYTLNLEVGCSGTGCAVREHCWAKWQAKRQKHRCSLCYSFVPHLHMERVMDLLKFKKGRRIGLNFMGETFDKALMKDVPNFVPTMLRELKRFPQHTFLILTKQPQNIPDELEFPENVWVGVSVNRQADVWRIAELRKKKAKIRFVSFEPLYEDLSGADLSGIHWLIVGAQMRPNLYPKYEWVLALLQKQIPVFLKNNLKPILASDKPCQQFPAIG